MFTPRHLPIVLAFAALAPAGAAGQTADPSGAVVRLTLADATRLALEHNVDLAVERIDPQMAETRVAQSRAAFAPALTSSLLRNSTVTPPTSFLVGERGVETSVFTSTLGVRQRLPWGSTYAVAWDGTRTTSTSPFTNFNPNLGSRLQLGFSQPLLRDRGIDTARQQLMVTRRNRDMSDLRFREAVVRTLADAKRAYWDLVAARDSVDVQEQSLELARELVRVNTARVDVGQAPPLDLVAARAEEAQREEALILARASLRQTQDRLRTLVLDPDAPDYWDIRIEPTDTPPIGGPPVDLEAAVSVALAGRTDLLRARKEVENAGINTHYAGNQRLPDVRFQAVYQTDGLGGNRLIRGDGFPGEVIGEVQTGFGRVLDQLFRRDFPTWNLGVTISYPIGRSVEDAAFARARLEERQSLARVRSLEIQITRELRDAASEVDTQLRRITTARAARDLAEQRLDAEQRRFEVGMSTSFLVVQAQRDLAQARNNELGAVLDYQRSVVEFEALQEASRATGAGAVAISGAAIVPVPPPAPIGTAGGQQAF